MITSSSDGDLDVLSVVFVGFVCKDYPAVMMFKPTQCFFCLILDYLLKKTGKCFETSIP